MNLSTISIFLASCISLSSADDFATVTLTTQSSYTVKEFWWQVNWDKDLIDNEGEGVRTEEIESWVLGQCLNVAADNRA